MARMNESLPFQTRKGYRKFKQSPCSLSYIWLIGKYLSRIRKFDQVIAPQERFEAQLRAPRLSITFGMSTLGMTRQIRDGRFQRDIEPCDVPGLQGLDNPA